MVHNLFVLNIFSPKNAITLRFFITFNLYLYVDLDLFDVQLRFLQIKNTVSLSLSPMIELCVKYTITIFLCVLSNPWPNRMHAVTLLKMDHAKTRTIWFIHLMGTSTCSSGKWGIGNKEAIKTQMSNFSTSHYPSSQQAASVKK